jgi:apyrase
LHYGLLAARAEILKAGEGNDYSECMLEGHHGMVAFFLIFKANI